MSNKVYVSSTYSDLKEFREAVSNILEELCYDVSSAEEELETDNRPIDKSLTKVKECDSYIGIFGWRYGHIPEGYDKAVTEMEYRQAGEANKLRFIFMADEDAPWDESNKDTGPDAELIQELRTRLAEDERVEFFDSPRDLAAKVAGSLASEANKQLQSAIIALREEQDRADEKRRALTEKQIVINVPPLNVDNFRGRYREIDDFNKYICESNSPVISIIGQGGFGKTALACHVMAEIQKQGKLPTQPGSREQPVAGVIYLSAVSTGLSLERIFSDAGRMLGEPASSMLEAAIKNPHMPLEAKVRTILEAMKDGLYIILLDNMETDQDETGRIRDKGLHLFVEQCMNQPDGPRLIITTRTRLEMGAENSADLRNIHLEKGLDEDIVVEVLRELDPEGKIGLRDASESQLRQVAELTFGIPRALEILAGLLLTDPDITLTKLLADKTVFGEEVMTWLVSASFEHLEEEARKVVQSLSVYQVPIIDMGVDFLLKPWYPGLDAKAWLKRLSDNFFVNVNKVTGEYRLHPLDMEYAYDKIPKKAENSKGGKHGTNAKQRLT